MATGTLGARVPPIDWHRRAASDWLSGEAGSVGVKERAAAISIAFQLHAMLARVHADGEWFPTRRGSRGIAWNE
jgi:hypothetical protein